MAKRRKKVAKAGPSTTLPLPRRVVYVDPATLGTADAGPVCRCDDSCEYATKGTSHHAQVPHSEWFCTHLAELVGISAPPCAIVEMNDGTQVFGSRWEGGMASGSPPPPPWWHRVKVGDIPLANIETALSRIYAFDHFVYNVDRHANNYLVRSSRNSHVVLANDYSRAWLTHGFPLPAVPIPASRNTVKCQRQLSKMFGPYIDPKDVREIMEQMKTVSVKTIRSIIESHPNNWLPKTRKSAILKWWSTGGMEARAEEVAKGIEDGTYL